MEEKEPPRLGQKILLWFLRKDLAEEVCGDLDEKFYSTIKNKSTLRAKLNYWYEVLHYVRPFAIRKSRLVHTNHYAMYKSYFKIGWRNLLRNKSHSFINIGGLGLGMAVVMFISVWVYDELSYNKNFENYDRLVQVMQHQTFNGVTNTGNTIPRPLENELRTTYGSDFNYISMCTWTGENILSTGDKKISKSGNYFQKDFPEMLSLKMISGTRDGLNDPRSILLSESTAKALFGAADPMGHTVRISNEADANVTGVYQDLPYNTSFKNLDFMASWELLINRSPWYKQALEDWGENSFQAFATLMPNTTIDEVSEKIKKVKSNLAQDQRQYNPEIFLSPMAHWHLRAEWKHGKNVGGRLQMVWLFAIIGLFVLLLACINFMNLSTARSQKRAKEVGIRLAIGSNRGQLINQFLSESLLVTLFAFSISLILVLLFLPFFNDLADKKITINWCNPYFWLLSAFFILFTGLLAGSYPAFYLSSFHPIKVLKGTFQSSQFSFMPRKVLVVIQFTVSLTLIISTVIIYRQIQFTKNRPVGYERGGLIMIQMKSSEFFGKFELLRTALKKTGAVEEVSQSSGPVTELWSNNSWLDWPGKDPSLQPEFATVHLSHEYGKTVGWTLVEGRDFSRELSTDSTAVILNEAALKFMDVKNPVGMEVTWAGQTRHIIGIIKDMVMQSPYKPVMQTIYVLDYKYVSWTNIKLNPHINVHEAISLVEGVFKKHITTAPFEYKFAGDEYAKKFDGDERLGKLASIFSTLAIAISLLGIFGLASFLAEQRTKEIGIRKVLGASILNLWKLLSKDFIALVLISCLVAVPFTYYFMDSWLQGYAYHAKITGSIFMFSCVGVLLLTLVIVSYHTVRAALTNPVNSLKSE